MAEVNDKTYPMPNQQRNSAHPATPARRIRKILFFVLKLVLTVLILLYLIDRIQWTALKAEFREIRWIPLIIGFMLTIPNLWIQYIKWRYLVKIADPAIQGKDIFRSLMCGMAIGLVTPGRLGELARGWYIRTNDHAPLIGMGILDKLFSVSALALIVLPGVVWMHPPERRGTVEWLMIILAGIIALMLLTVIIYPGILRALLRLFKKAVYTLPLYRKIFALISATDHFHHKQLMMSLGYGFIFQSVIYTQFFWLLQAFSDADYLPVFFAVNLAMFLKTLLPVAVMDLGVREGAVVFFLTKTGVTAAAAFNASLLLFISNVLLPGMIGLFYLIHQHFFQPQQGGHHDSV